MTEYTKIKKNDEISITELHKIKAKLAKQKRQTRIILIGIAFVIIIIGLVVYFNLISNPQKGFYVNGLSETDDEIKIPLSALQDNEIHYYIEEGKKFYVHKNSQGNIHTRISFCKPCLGTTFTLIEGGNILDCDECHTRWDSETYEGIYPVPGEIRGGITITAEEIGCEDYPPPYLPSILIDDYVIIKKSDLNA